MYIKPLISVVVLLVLSGCKKISNWLNHIKYQTKLLKP